MTQPLDLVDGRLPLPLGGGDAVGVPIGGGVVLGVPSSDVDVTVEGIPFWLAIDQNYPYQRQTAPFKKDQVDQQPEAGEQSLQSWWLRSQMSFHMGAGLRYLDTTARPDEIDRVRFADGRGIDVWTPGVVKRLNGTALAQASAASRIWLETAVVGGTELVIIADGATVKTYDGTTFVTLYTGTFAAFCIDGANWYVASTSGVWKGPLAGGAATQLYTVTGTGAVVLGWVKARLMAAVGSNIYELDCNAAANSALPTAKLLHPVAGWTWTAFCETPNGVGYVGYAGLTSQVYKSEINTDSGAPVLGAGVVLLTLPPGEIANAAMLYLGSMLVLGTNRGIRVSTFQSYFGTVTLGPLVQLSGDGVTMNITALSAFDRFLFGGTSVDGAPALVRVDLGMPIDQPGHYPWAYDLLPPAGATTIPGGATVSAITLHASGLKVWAVPGYGVITESAGPDPAQPAWFTTARIRVGSVEDKHWAHGIVRGTLDPADTITVEAMTPVDGWTHAYDAQTNGDRFDLHLSKSEWLQLRFTLHGTAQLNSYVVQALPGGKRQRMLTVPLWLMDYQVTRSGQACGYDGWAIDRLEALETIEAAGAEITVSAPALFPYAVRGVIEQLTFQQTDDPGDRATGTGGRLVVQLRTTS